ncbi:MAG: hypothetical protein EOO48_04665 [Flavobacterium sp.]|nr:MAG: hypothetical protein EOO48_04665 [Flavobacterium sp.]
MRRLGHKYLIVLISILALTGCAKRGNITGGTKDTLAPVLKVSFPKNYGINFKGREIKLVFDEYVKLKDVNKQLIISPPMAKAPDISPQTASKTITIKINDTLRPNTTYSFNFGQSIEDNNESNPYPQFKYVFSTGSYIDSLSLRGVVKDAYNKDVEHFVSVMLYEVDEKFNDSVVYKENPRYITNTLDSLKTFQLENLKAGKYLLVAMKDYNNNYKFDPKQDKIAFHKQYVTIPNDTLYEMELFKEKVGFKAIKPSLASGNRFYMGYNGDPKGVSAVLKNGPDVVQTLITKVANKDSVNIWYKPVKADSLRLSVTKENYKEDFTLKFKAAKNDSLTLTPMRSGTLPPREEYTLNASRPLVKFDNSLMKLTKDSVEVPFTTTYDEFDQKLKFTFAKEPLSKYRLQLLPGAVTDFYEKSNDSLTFKFDTKASTDYGNLRVTLKNVRKFPVIVELTDAKGIIIASEYSTQATQIDFDGLEPAKYTLRLIYDENGNKEWDTGSLLEKRQSEEVIYFPTPIDVRANWDWDQTFSLP